MRKYFIVIISILFFTACWTPPQTREEFINLEVKTETYIINRSFEDVVKDLKKKTDSCLNKRFESYYKQKYATEKSLTIYVPSVVVVQADKAEFPLRVLSSPKILGAPDDGMFMSAADIYRLSKKQTKIIIYGFTSGFYGEIMSDIKLWCEGKNPPCPNIQ